MKILNLDLKKFSEITGKKIYSVLNKNPKKSVIVMFCILCLATIFSITKAIYRHNKQLPDVQAHEVKIYDIPNSYKSGIKDDILNLIELNNLGKEFKNMDSTNIDSAKLMEINKKLNKIIKR